MAIFIWWKQGGRSGVSSGFNESKNAYNNDDYKNSVEKKSGNPDDGS